ncbi:reverse transcriptase domain-containing protein [Tanacetum coccineum]
MTINEYIEYEERMKRQYSRNDIELDEEARYTFDEGSVTSKHEALDPAHVNDARSLDEELSSEEDLDEWLKGELEKHMSKQDEKNDEDALIAIIKSIRDQYASNNVMPRSICEYLMLEILEEASMSKEMDELSQQETLGTVKNVSVKIEKFEFPCNFIVSDMPENLGEMIIL